MLRRDPDEIFMTGFKEAIADMAPLAKNLCFFADTELLATAYEKQFDITCAVLPVMCDISLLAPHNASSYPIILTYLGSAGQEKGFHLLPLLLEKLAAYPHFDRLECHIQAYVPPNHYDPVIDAAITRLESYVPQVRLYRDELPQVDYLKLLMQSHIVLLPYDAKAYKSRSSGVLMQAMAAGKVTVIPDHTWLSYAAPVQASQRFSGDSFADAVIKALEQYELLASSAYDYSKSMDFQKLSAKFYQILTD